MRDLSVLIKQARLIVDTMSPEEIHEMLYKQAQSWARSELQWAQDFRDGKESRD